MQIRKTFTIIEESRSEAGHAAAVPLRKVAAVAVVTNVFAGRAYADDLGEHIEASRELARLLGRTGREAMGDLAIESYGKAAIVGIEGEQEHGVALLTTVFGDALRAEAGGGKAWISSATKRAAPGSQIDVPLAYKDALFVRSHYDAMTLVLADAPLPREIAIIACFANRGRLNDRVGGLRKDEIAGHDGLR